MNGWKQTAFLIFQDSTFACFKSGFPIQIVELIHSNWIFCLRFYLRVGLNQSAKFNEFGWNFLHSFFSFSFSLFREVITFLEFFPPGEWVCNKYFLLSKKKEKQWCQQNNNKKCGRDWEWERAKCTISWYNYINKMLKLSYK